MVKWKWLLRGASLLIMLGFFMPAVLVSCNAGFFETGETLSLAEVAKYLDVPILYIVPILSIAAIVLSFLQDVFFSSAAALLWGQLGALGLQIFILVMTIVSMSSEVPDLPYSMIEIKARFGTFLIVGSAALYLAAWVMQKKTSAIPIGATPFYKETLIEEQEDPFLNRPLSPPYASDELMRAPVEQLPSQPTLVVLAGNIASRQIQISNDGFSIGRSSSNHLLLEDQTVSREHAVFRYSQGVWFLQDQESTRGTFVNGIRTDAIRLNDRDEIGIGPYRFQFRLNQER